MNSKISAARSARALLAATAKKSGAHSNGKLSAAMPSASQSKTHRRASEIIEAAAHIFAKLGYHGASTQDVADVLGIRQASLYYYFPSKEVALEIVCVRGVEHFLKAAGTIAKGPGNATQKLTDLMQAHISPLTERGDFVKVFLTQRQFLPRKSRRRIGKWSRAIERLFEKVIRDGVRSGEFRSDANPRLVTLGILGMMNAVVGWYGKEPASIDKISSEYAALVLRGLTSDSERR
jgi:TetR/AcrR family transcriptional regulator, cholesterol catabolism regulator